MIETFTKPQAALMKQFLTDYYMTLGQLSLELGISEKMILLLERSQCIPGHTYEYRRTDSFSCSGVDSYYDEYSMDSTEIYFHKSVVRWINSSLEKVPTTELSDIAKKVKDEFRRDLDEYLGKQRTPGCNSFDQAWQYFIDGTWGKCLKNISVKCLASKELARKEIAALIHINPVDISDNYLANLNAAVATYIDSSLPFDPLGQRHTVALEPINKFNLDIDLDFYGG